MSKEKVDLRQELTEFKAKFNLIQKIPCSKEDNKRYTQMRINGQALPDGVYAYEYYVADDYTEFYTLYIPDLSAAEINEYLTYKQLALLNTIKNCVVFFTVLTVIGLVGGLLLLA